MKAKTELKAALASLQVGKPLKLSAPTFTRPTQVAEKALVENSTSVVKTTPAPVTTGVINPTSVKSTTQVAFETQAANPTPVQLPTPVKSTTVVGKQTPVEIQTEVNPVSASRRATEQDSSVILEARAAEGLEKGYTRLPNTTLMRLASGDFTKNEIKIALLIARFTISFQRKHAPLSKTVLERRSGLRGAAVLEALSGLLQKGLIEKIQGDQHRPNQLGLVLPPEWDQLINPNGEGRVTPVAIPTGVEIVTSVENSTPAEVRKPTQAGVGNPTYFKDSEIYKNSLSQLPEKIREYFGDLKPARKRESEWNAFQELQRNYSAEDIADSLAFVLERGIGEGEHAQPCHSPMAFLARAIGDVLSQVKTSRAKRQRTIDDQRAQAEAAKSRQTEQEREERELTLREQAFVRAFPSPETQQGAIAKYGAEYSGVVPSGGILRRLAIGAWWQSQE